MKKLITVIAATLLAFSAHAQVSVPSSLSVDLDSPASMKWLKTNKRIADCATNVIADMRKSSPDAMISSETYSEIITHCASFKAAAANKPMQGDMLDYAWSAKPNTNQDAQDRRTKRSWQDKNGFIHFPDGTISAHPM
jgi:hypothetical protein